MIEDFPWDDADAPTRQACGAVVGVAAAALVLGAGTLLSLYLAGEFVCRRVADALLTVGGEPE